MRGSRITPLPPRIEKDALDDFVASVERRMAVELAQELIRSRRVKFTHDFHLTSGLEPWATHGRPRIESRVELVL